jgi:hypothetical protein
MHDVLFNSSGYVIPGDLMESFHLLREMRNSTIHVGGKIQPGLTTRISAMGSNSTADWQRLSGQLPGAVVQTGQVTLIAEHIFTAFAITKSLGREINAALTSALPKSSWARIAVEDYQSVTSKIKNSAGWRRSLVGYARQYYDSAKMTEVELEKASRHLGYWTLGAWK